MTSIFSSALQYSAILLIMVWSLPCYYSVVILASCPIFRLSSSCPIFCHTPIANLDILLSSILLSSNLLCCRSSVPHSVSFVVYILYSDIPCLPFCHFLSTILPSSCRILNHHPVHYYAVLLYNILPLSCEIFCCFLVKYSAVLIFKISPFSCSVFCHPPFQ
jgi:hypothetical protein